jgi:hypothetical protein
MTDDTRLWPRFSPEINFGHLLQAAVILVTIGGGAITSYLSLRSDIQQVRADLTVKVNEHGLRIATIEHADFFFNIVLTLIRRGAVRGVVGIEGGVVSGF